MTDDVTVTINGITLNLEDAKNMYHGLDAILGNTFINADACAEDRWEANLERVTVPACSKCGYYMPKPGVHICAGAARPN